MSDNKDIDKNLMADHEYDGIQELDNPLPNWWLFIFFATIIFGALYYIHYELAGGPSTSEELAMKMESINKARAAAEANQPQVSGDDLQALLNDPTALDQGAQVYQSSCAACHGDKGQGMIGPNLTDDHWIHGHQLTDIMDVIRNGVTEKGMPAWKDSLNAKQIQTVTAYVKSLDGSNVPGGKPPEGTEVR